MSKRRKFSIEEDVVPVKKLKLNTLTTLRERSLIKVVVPLWNQVSTQKIFRVDPSALKDFDSLWYRNYLLKEAKYGVFGSIIDTVKKLPIQIPSDVVNLIRNQLHTIVKKITAWIKYHQKRIFFDRSDPTHAVFHITSIVWTCNGNIDYLQTANNLIFSSTNKNLSVKEKYRILCTYCMDQEIEKLKRLQFIDETCVNLEDHPLLKFWNCIVKHNSPKFGILRYLSVEYCLESKMVMMVDNVYALRYFWKFVHNDKKVEKAVILIERHGLLFQDFFLEELNIEQLNALFASVGPKLIENYAKNSECLEKAWLIWLYTRQHFSGKQYLKMILNLKNFKLKDFKTDFFVNVWKTTPEHLKRYVLVENKTLLNNLTTYYPSFSHIELRKNISALLVILPDLDFDIRNSMLKSSSQWPMLCVQWPAIFKTLITECHKAKLMMKFLKLCVADENEMNNIAKKWIDLKCVRDYCLYMIENAKWKGLDEFLSFYKPPVDASVFKKQILRSKKGIEMCACRFRDSYDEESDSLNRIVDPIFSRKNAAMSFKKKVLTSGIIIHDLHEGFVDGQDIGSIEECFTKCLPNKKHIEFIKKKLIRVYENPKKLVELFLCNHICKEYLEWLFKDNANGMQNLKNSIDNETIFFKLLKKIAKRYVKYQEDEFSHLDNYLNWYFNENKQDIERFKLEKVLVFYNINAINKFFPSRPDIDLQKILKWFYNDDEIRVRKLLSIIEMWSDEIYCI